MKALSFPTFLYHAEHAPHGKIFQAESDVPTDAGWVDNPAKFAADYVAPQDVEPADGTVPADAAAAGYKPAHYPAHLYHRETKDVVTVESPEAHAALEVKFPNTYLDTPDVAAHAARQARAAAGDASSTAPVAPAFSDAAVVTLSEDQKAAFAKANVPQVIEQLETISNPALVAALQAAEDGRPGGPRTTVVKALKARALTLAA